MKEMRDSGIEWMGDIPSDWNIRRLRFLCNITTGNMDTQDNNPEGEYPFYVRSPIVEHSDKYTFDNEAVLMAGDGVGAGKVFHYVKGKYGCHQRVYSLSGFSSVTGKYLYYFLLENFYKKIEESNAKSTVDSVRLPMIKDFSVAFPHIEEQERIVSFLDEKCSKIDQIIVKQEKIIERLKDYKVSIITEAVTHGLDSKEELMFSGDDFTGDIPKGWKLVKIKNVASTITDGAHVSPETENGKYDFLSTVNIEQDYIHFENCLKTSETSYQQLVASGCQPQKGDVLISKDGSVGRTVIVTEDRIFVVASSLVIIRPIHTLILSEYLNYSLQSKPVQDTLLMMMHGAGLKRVSVAKNANLKIALPNLDRQKIIIDYLNAKCRAINIAIHQKEQIVEQLRNYKKSLIYEAVTGKKEIN